MLDHDDDNLFQQAMQDVQPLRQDQHRPHATPAKLPRKNKAAVEISPRTEPVFNYELMDQSCWVDRDEIVKFHRSGIALKTLQQLRSGKLCSEASLDLHRHTAGQAILAVDAFLECALQQGHRVVTIIHGKGHKSQHQKPILKNLLIEHLRNNLFVLAYHSTQPRDGGAGALNVLLKAASKVTP